MLASGTFQQSDVLAPTVEQSAQLLGDHRQEGRAGQYVVGDIKTNKTKLT